MKQITNKEYEEWQKYKEEKAKGHVLMPDTLHSCRIDRSFSVCGENNRCVLECKLMLGL